MLHSLALVIYNRIILPVLYVLVNLLAPFVSTLRGPVFGRHKTISKLKDYIASQKPDGRPYVVIHAASMGEFEHIKPLIARLVNVYKARIVVTFFSPSGYNNVKQFPGVELFVYAPVDFPGAWKKFYNILKPKLVVISKHDVWSNQVLQAKHAGVAVILANASLGEHSRRVSPLARFLLQPVYQQMDRVFAIAEEDKRRLETLFHLKQVFVCGDTKFDQVTIRKERLPGRELIPKNWYDQGPVVIFGSIWPQGAEVVLAGMNDLLKENPRLNIIIAPHVPNTENLEMIRDFFPNQSMSFISEGFPKHGSHILVVDTIGILADLYRYAQIAYIGGGFRQGIHNVMEAAVYEIPVIFGPVNKNASEAGELAISGGGFVINSSNEFNSLLKNFLEDEAYRKKTGAKAGEFARKNTGATKRIINDPVVKKALSAIK